MVTKPRKLVAAVCFAGAAAACAAVAASAAGDPFFAAAKARVAKMTGAQTQWTGPTTGPKLTPGKRIVYVSCGSFNDICVQVGNAIKEASSKAGWKATVIDGKGTTSGWIAAWHQAIALKPDGIIALTDAIATRSAIAEARKQKIPVVGVLAAATPGPHPELGLFTNVSQDPASIGRAEADFAIADSGGKARAIIQYASQYTIARIKAKAMRSEFAKCKACKVLEVANVDATTIQQRTPDIVSNWVTKYGTPFYVTSVGDVLVSFMPAPLQSGGVPPGKVKLIAADGNASAYQLIHQGRYQVATIPQSFGELGYQAVDEMNRALNGAKPSGFVQPLYIVTKDNVSKYGGNKGKFEPANDYQGHYLKIWKG